jgi:tetratricopeptide (TPR) repeat protein
VFRTILLFLTLAPALLADGQEKAEKKELTVQAKAIVAEAKNLENTGKIAEARVKYAESQAMIETNEAADAIKHLDDEIHRRVQDSLARARKLFESRKYPEATALLEEAEKLGHGGATLSYNLALCRYQLGDREKAVEDLNQAIRATPDPKIKLKEKQLLAYFSTGDNRSGITDKERIDNLDRLLDKVGLDAVLGDGLQAEEDDAPTVTSASLKTSSSSPANIHSVAARRASLCADLDTFKDTLAASAPAVFDRANCAQSNARPSEAVRLLQRYLELSPNALDAADVKQRIADLQSLLSLSESNGAEVRRLYASAYSDLAEGQYDRALTTFTRAKELAPDFPLTYWKLALFHEAMGNVDSARESFSKFQQLTSEQSAKDDAALHLSTLDAKKSKYDEEVEATADILEDLFNRGMNLTFNFDEKRGALRANRAKIKKKKEQKYFKNIVGGFAVPHPYAQQQLARASEHLTVALALFPLGVEANELMGLVFLQANDGPSATKSFDVVASEGLPVSFYAEMRGGHKFDHAVKCELTRDRVRFIFLSSYDKNQMPIPPDKNAGEDGLGDLTLKRGEQRLPFDSLEFSINDIKKVETHSGMIGIKLAKEQFALSPIYLPSFTPVQGPPARRFANDYTRLFVRYPGLEDSKLGAEGMTGGEKFVMGLNLADAGFNIATSLNPVGAISATQSAISIARTINSAMASLRVSYASWERSAQDQQQLLAAQAFKSIPSEPVSLTFTQEIK